jgi:hypothetical protein
MKIPKSVCAAATATLLVVGFAAPASADDTTATFTLTGGELTLSVGATAALTDEASGVAANTISGALGTVTVTDGRGGTDDWTMTAASTTFTGDGLSVSDGVAYTNGEVAATGISTVAGVTAEPLTADPTAVATATAVSGNNTASWNPTIDVSMPAGALAGDYSGTVTHSLL